MTSKVHNALKDARTDIENAAWPGIIGAVMNPLKDLIIAPAVGAAEFVVPKVTNMIPFADPVVGMGIRLSSGVFKTAYTILPHEEEIQTLASETVEEDSKTTTTLNRNYWMPGSGTGLVFSMVGFATNTVLDLALADGQKVQDWKKSIETLKGFLVHVEKSDLVRDAFLSRRLICNCIIISRIQEKLGLGNQKRADKAAFRDSINPYADREELSLLLGDARKYMKYATAAYGAFQTLALPSVTNPDNTRPEEIPASSPGQSRRIELIRNNLGFNEYFAAAGGVTERVGEIIYMTDAGGDSRLIGHFVAVDNVEKAVILAVRGTYSISGAIADSEAQSIPFYGGRAHKGIADRAKYLWKDVKPKIDEAFRDYLGYKLVLTGHSLGGGVANLINIIIHEEKYRAPSQIVCYGFASPPTFKTEQPTDAVKQAIAVSHCFITEDDTVPFLSAYSIFRFAKTLTNVDKFTRNMSIIDQYLVAENVARAPPNLIELVRNAARDLEPGSGYERLEIAAKAVLWMRKTRDANWKAPVICNPTLLATHPIFVTERMVFDHFPPQYEEATKFS